MKIRIREAGGIYRVMYDAKHRCAIHWRRPPSILISPKSTFPADWIDIRASPEQPAKQHHLLIHGKPRGALVLKLMKDKLSEKHRYLLRSI